MSISITGKLNKAANQFQAGDGKGFGIRLGVRFYNRETKEQEYTNYEAVIFAREGAQADFYTSALVEGSIVEVSGSGCQIKTFEGSNGAVNTISILDSKLGFVFSGAAKQASTPQATQAVITDDIPF